MGCGFNKHKDFLNIDKFSNCEPDLLMDIEVLPWPLEDNAADLVVFHHSLEHVGQNPDIFLGIMKELYRISKPGAKIQINVPHPRHDNFISDPTHVRTITPLLLSLFSKKNNHHWKQIGASNSPFAIYLDVDFELEKSELVIEKKYIEMLNKGDISMDALIELASHQCNIASEYKFVLNVIK